MNYFICSNFLSVCLLLVRYLENDCFMLLSPFLEAGTYHTHENVMRSQVVAMACLENVL